MTSEHIQPAESAAAVRRVLLVTLFLNLAVATAKGVYGVWSGSLAIASDAVHSTMDGSANIIGLVMLRLSEGPPDVRHPYGHRKIEILASAFLGILIAAAALHFGWSAVEALVQGGVKPEITWVGFVIVGCTLGVNVFVALYESRRAKELKSPFLAADAAHTASDVLITAGVLISMVLTRAGYTWADAVAGVIVTLLVGRVAWQILASSLDILIDCAVCNEDEVVAVALSVSGISGCHRVRSRGTVAAAWLDLHLQMDGALSLEAAHELTHEVENQLRLSFPFLVDVTIHMEPSNDPAETL